MTTASLELSKELFEVSGWEGTEKNHYSALKGDGKGNFSRDWIPAYDLGILRKAILDSLSNGTYTEEEYTLIIANLANALVNGEDSTCEYAIKLFKEGKLKM